MFSDEIYMKNDHGMHAGILDDNSFDRLLKNQRLNPDSFSVQNKVAFHFNTIFQLI